MITKQHLKIFLSFLSLTALFLGGCSTEDKLGSGTQSSQVSGDSSAGKRTNLPIWTKDYVYGGESSSKERKLSFYAGNWYGIYEYLNKLLLTINTDGSVIFYEDSYVGSDAGSKIITIPYSSMTKTSGVGSLDVDTYERYSFSYGGSQYSLTFYTNEAHYTWGGWGTTFNSMLGGGGHRSVQLIYHERHKDLYKDLQ